MKLVQNARYVRYLSELMGTAGLLCAVIGSGIKAEQLAGGNIGLALLANAAVTMLALFVFIEIFAPTSGAHFNPAVSLVMLMKHQLSPLQFLGYVLAQLLGAAAGVWLAHLMFGQPLLQVYSKSTLHLEHYIAEIIATAGLLLVALRAPSSKVALLVACYIGAAIWFTASASFANPAGVFARMLSNTFAGVAPSDALPLILAQLLGCFLAFGMDRLLSPALPASIMTSSENAN